MNSSTILIESLESWSAHIWIPLVCLSLIGLGGLIFAIWVWKRTCYDAGNLLEENKK